MSEIHTSQPVAGRSRRAAGRGPYLHSPLIDFLCLGGGSIPVLVAAVLLIDAEYRPAALIASSVLAVFINDPHFMASYQIFYGRFGEKVEGRRSALARRYLFAGVVVPVILIAYFAWCALTADPVMLGWAANAMLFFVGWHYVKQGYGILIVESVLHRAFFGEAEKTLLRWNGLATWIFSWIYGNRLIHASDLHGMQYFSLGLPDWAAWLAGIAAMATGAAALVVLGRRAMAGRLPLNGVCGYVAGVYLWMMLAYFDPMLLLLGPLFHSLQYLAVVWRYELNKSDAAADDDARPLEMLSGLVRVSAAQAGLIRFVYLGLVAGTLAFFIVPEALDWAIAYREDLFGPSMFLVMFVVFINIHHYFMDNVMWRKENPDIRANLFR